LSLYRLTKLALVIWFILQIGKPIWGWVFLVFLALRTKQLFRKGRGLRIQPSPLCSQCEWGFGTVRVAPQQRSLPSSPKRRKYSISFEKLMPFFCRICTSPDQTCRVRCWASSGQGSSAAARCCRSQRPQRSSPGRPSGWAGSRSGRTRTSGSR